MACLFLVGRGGADAPIKGFITRILHYNIDRVFGLDLKAIEAARQWRFFPGTRQGEPVPVFVNIELEFNLR